MKKIDLLPIPMKIPQHISGSTTICGIIGYPVAHSLSPIMHNKAYQAKGLDFVYVAFPVTDVKDAIKGIRALNIRGVSVTIPHKQSIIPYLDKIDPLAKKIGAINTIVNNNGKLTGYNTDWEGCLKALEEKTRLNGKKVAVIGAGGAARAIVFGLKSGGAKVTIFNRTFRKARALAKDATVDARPLESFATDNNFNILINTTSLGMHPHEKKMPVPKACLKKNMVVHDIVYAPKTTLLLKEAKKKGCQIVYGYKMLLYQGAKQFELFTNKKAPIDVMEKTLSTSPH